MGKIFDKLPRLEGFWIFLLVVLILLRACSDNAAGSNPDTAVPAASNTDTPVQSEQSADTAYHQSDPPTPVAVEEVEEKEAGPFSENPQGREQYRAVLQEGAVFYETAYEEEMTLEQFHQFCYGGEEAGFTVSRFAVVDLDRDGQMEVILEVTVHSSGGHSYPFDFEILRCQDDIVYGYSIPYRAFRSLGTDGTFYGSSGAAWEHWDTLQFDADTYTRITYAHTEDHYNSDGYNELFFFVGEENVSESDYYTRVAEWRTGKAARWYPFTDENLNWVFTE